MTSMTRSEFISAVQEIVARGSSITEGRIGRCFDRAANEIQSKNKFDAMFCFKEGMLDTAASKPRTVFLDSWQVRSVEFFRLISGGEYFHLTRTDPETAAPKPVGMPECYWLSQETTFILDRIPDQNYPIEIGYWKKCFFPELADDTNWMLEKHATVLVDGTLMFLFAELRDRQSAQIHRELFMAALRDMIDEQEDREFDNQELVMRTTE